MLKIAVIVAVILLLAIAFLVGLMVWILCKAAKEEFAEEDPCETCVRWEECNGVDTECPRRQRDA